MNQPLKVLTALICATVLLFSACKKEPKNKTTCSSTLYGFNGIDIPGSSTPRTFGVINPITAMSATVASFSGWSFATQGAYNTSDDCYYAFVSSWSLPSWTYAFYKITASGSVTSITPAAGGPVGNIEGLLYNRVNNKLYGVSSAAAGGTIFEVNVTGTTYTLTTVAPTLHGAGCNYPVTSTVDNNTGDIYYAIIDHGIPVPGVYYIEKYHPGASVATLVHTDTGADIMGLRFNKNDNMLYAVKQYHYTSACDFIKISPTGTLTTLSTLPFRVNEEFYSACIDPCNDRYLVSTPDHGGPSASTTFLLAQINMSGTVVQQDTITSIFQGMDVDY